MSEQTALKAATEQNLVDYTVEADAGDASATFRPSNSETVIEVLFEEVRKKQQAARGTSFVALETNAEIGRHLLELKKNHIADQETFLREVKNRLGFKRAWCLRLCQLGENWLKI